MATTTGDPGSRAGSEKRRALWARRAAQAAVLLAAVLSIGLILQERADRLAAAQNPAAVAAAERAALRAETPRYFWASDPDAVILAAVDQGDFARARHFRDMAARYAARGPGLRPETLARLEAEDTTLAMLGRVAANCVNGVFFRDYSTFGSLACDAAVQATKLGDAKDVVYELYHWSRGDDVDVVVLGLSVLELAKCAVDSCLKAPDQAYVAKIAYAAAGKVLRRAIARAVENAIDFEKMERMHRVEFVNAVIRNPRRFVREEQAARLWAAAGDLYVVLERTDFATAYRALRRAASFAEIRALRRAAEAAGGGAESDVAARGDVHTARDARAVMAPWAAEVADAARPVASAGAEEAYAASVGALLFAALLLALAERGAERRIAAGATRLLAHLAIAGALYVEATAGAGVYRSEADARAAFDRVFARRAVEDGARVGG